MKITFNSTELNKMYDMVATLSECDPSVSRLDLLTKCEKEKEEIKSKGIHTAGYSVVYDETNAEYILNISEEFTTSILDVYLKRGKMFTRIIRTIISTFETLFELFEAMENDLRNVMNKYTLVKDDESKAKPEDGTLEVNELEIPIDETLAAKEIM